MFGLAKSPQVGNLSGRVVVTMSDMLWMASHVNHMTSLPFRCFKLLTLSFMHKTWFAIN
jgi:hypothetical protein